MPKFDEMDSKVTLLQQMETEISPQISVSPDERAV